MRVLCKYVYYVLIGGVNIISIWLGINVNHNSFDPVEIFSTTVILNHSIKVNIKFCCGRDYFNQTYFNRKGNDISLFEVYKLVATTVKWITTSFSRLQWHRVILTRRICLPFYWRRLEPYLNTLTIKVDLSPCWWGIVIQGHIQTNFLRIIA